MFYPVPIMPMQNDRMRIAFQVNGQGTAKKEQRLAAACASTSNRTSPYLDLTSSLDLWLGYYGAGFKEENLRGSGSGTTARTNSSYSSTRTASSQVLSYILRRTYAMDACMEGGPTVWDMAY